MWLASVCLSGSAALSVSLGKNNTTSPWQHSIYSPAMSNPPQKPEAAEAADSFIPSSGWHPSPPVELAAVFPNIALPYPESSSSIAVRAAALADGEPDPTVM